MTEASTAILRGQITSIVVGSLFVFVGLASGTIATVRGRGVRTFGWLGLWSCMYGAVQLGRCPAVVAALPPWLFPGNPFVDTALSFLIVVAGSLAFLDLTVGRLRRVVHVTAVAGAVIAAGALVAVFTGGSVDRWRVYNNLLSTGVLLLLAFIVAVPRLSRQYLVLPDRRVLALGTFTFAVQVVTVNIAHLMGFSTPPLLGHIGFGVLLFSFGYAALALAVGTERRLLAVESELDIARRMQLDILPDGVPEMPSIQMSAAYRPMTAVAGDYYEFVPVDERRVGILIADVAGHGVSAALIASMIKIAMQSVVTDAAHPGAVLRGLNRVLSRQLRGRLVSAAYLWLDLEQRTARYAAAGHPPLLRWDGGTLESIESNGVLFGVVDDCDYPVRHMTIDPGHRFLLYTDGVTDPENGRGEFFGDSRLEEVVRRQHSRSSADCSAAVLAEIGRWRPPSVPQQDDITLVIVDVV